MSNNFGSEYDSWLDINETISCMTRVAINQRDLMLDAGVDERFADAMACQVMVELLRWRKK
jgi:hypothetical protein